MRRSNVVCRSTRAGELWTGELTSRLLDRLRSAAAAGQPFCDTLSDTSLTLVCCFIDTGKDNDQLAALLTQLEQLDLLDRPTATDPSGASTAGAGTLNGY